MRGATKMKIILIRKTAVCMLSEAAYSGIVERCRPVGSAGLKPRTRARLSNRARRFGVWRKKIRKIIDDTREGTRVNHDLLQKGGPLLQRP
jgi:hypothetical protein